MRALCFSSARGPILLSEHSTNLHHRPLNLTRTNWIRYHSNVGWHPFNVSYLTHFMPRSSCRITLFCVNAAASFTARGGLFYCHVLFFCFFRILLEFHTAFEPEGHEWSTAFVEAELQAASIKECPPSHQTLQRID